MTRSIVTVSGTPSTSMATVFLSAAITLYASAVVLVRSLDCWMCANCSATVRADEGGLLRKMKYPGRTITWKRGTLCSDRTVWVISPSDRTSGRTVVGVSCIHPQRRGRPQGIERRPESQVLYVRVRSAFSYVRLRAVFLEVRNSGRKK